MNSFNGFALSGANKTRYLPIWGNAAGLVGAYRKYAEPHKKYEPTPLGIGQIPLFLLDGELSPESLKRKVEKLKLERYVAIYRPYDIRLKMHLEALYMKCCRGGFIKKDGSVAEWVLEDKHRAETIDDGFKDERERPIQPYLSYEKVLVEYSAAINVSPVNAVTGREIAGDINDFLYERAKTMFPLGLESIQEVNVKQSAIPKHHYFIAGMDNSPAPKGVRVYDRGERQVSLFDTGAPSIEDTVKELRDFLMSRVHRDGGCKPD